MTTQKAAPDDWPAILRQIRRHGRMRLIDIAVECGCTESALAELASRRTREPRYSTGQALKALHFRVVTRKTGNSEVVDFVVV